MGELDNIKDAIDEELINVFVSKKLKMKTLNHVFKKDSYFNYFKHNWMRFTTIFSVFVIMLTLSINNYVFDNDEPQVINPTNIEKYNTSNNPANINILTTSPKVVEENVNDSCDVNP